MDSFIAWLEYSIDRDAHVIPSACSRLRSMINNRNAVVHWSTPMHLILELGRE